MSAGRITQASVANSALRGLQGNLSRLQALQNQLSNGKRISKASDDPSGAASAMTLRSRRAADEQYLRNIDTANGRLSVTDNTLTQLADRLRAVRDLVIQSRNGSIGAESQVALGSEAEAIRHEIINLYNTTYLDRPIFGGTVVGQTALDSSGNYVGDNGAVGIRISSDAVMRIDVTGTASGADAVPAMLATVATNISNSAAGDADLDNIDAAITQILKALGDVGARTSRVDTTKNMIDSHRLDLTSRISVNEDVDLPEAIMNLSAQQVGYQSALQAAAKIQQISLADFLK